MALTAAKLKTDVAVDEPIITTTADKVKIVMTVVFFPSRVFVSEIAKPH